MSSDYNSSSFFVGRECCVGEIASALRQGQSLASFHLKVLKDAGLIVSRRSGRRVYYSVAPSAGEQLQALLDRGRQAAGENNHFTKKNV
jgi:DNA-binding transcriptional ArsR family regulator